MAPDLNAAHGTAPPRDAAGPDRPGVRVQLLDLRRRFADIHALDGLTLEVEPGELVALLGPSGCGKTTALRALAGLESIDTGQILLDGRDITELPANRRDMGVVFQAYSLFPHLTARGNVEFGLRLRGRPAPERRRTVDRLLELMHLGGRGSYYPHQLSGGQQQRVALARALAIEPQVLLLDEPLSALDAKVRAHLRDEIRRVQREVGTTTLFVTHDQDEALAIADRVAVVFNGRLAQIASPTELYERPRTAEVAEFVGLSNHLPGVAHGGEAAVLDTRLPLLDGSPTSGAIKVLVRPEAVELAPDPGGQSWVEGVVFLGAVARVQVVTADNVRLTAQLSGGDATRFAVGDPVQVKLRSAAVIAVPS